MTLQQAFARRRLRLTLLGVWTVGIALDAATTWVALNDREGFRESSPVPAWLMQQLGLAPTLLIGSLACAVLAWLTALTPTTRTYALIQAAVAPVAVAKLSIALNNLRLLV